FLPMRRPSELGHTIAPVERDGPIPANHSPLGYAAMQHERSGTGGAEPPDRGVFGAVLGMLGHELRQLAESALTTAVASLKHSINARIPDVVDAAVHRTADQVVGSSAE